MSKVSRNTCEGKLFGVWSWSRLANHFKTVNILFRIGFICSILFLGTGIIQYFIFAIIICEKPIMIQ